jgi:hypothetical protein
MDNTFHEYYLKDITFSSFMFSSVEWNLKVMTGAPAVI